MIDRTREGNRNTTPAPRQLFCVSFFISPSYNHGPSKVSSQLIKSRRHLRHQILFHRGQQQLALRCRSRVLSRFSSSPQLLDNELKHIDGFIVCANFIFGFVVLLQSFVFRVCRFSIGVVDCTGGVDGLIHGQGLFSRS